MRQAPKDNDFYELRPFLIILFGLLGVFNSLFVPGNPVLNHLAQFCGVVLLFCAAKIIRWRKNFRNQWL
jgi:hypothetical protein